MLLFVYLFIFQLLFRSAIQYQSALTVYVFPPASSMISLCCWSNSTTVPFSEMNEFNYTGEISWTIDTVPRTASYYDGYWCRARMGSNVMVRWAVFGDGVDRNNSEWIVNSRGRRRLSLNGRLVDDQRGSWVVT